MNITWEQYELWLDSLSEEKQDELINSNSDDILDYLEAKRNA